MQLRQMKYITAVIECGSFRLAAEQLYLSQPALSQAVKSLEEELGFPLLVRGSEGVFPTEMGELVYRDMKEILDTLEHKTAAWSRTHRQRCACTDVVRLGYSSDTWHLVEWARERLAQAYPNLRLRLTEGRDRALMEGLTGGRLDVILSDYIDSRADGILSAAAACGIRVHPLCADAYRIAISAASPFSGQPCLSAADARRLSLARFSSGDEAAELFFERWFDPTLGVEFNSFEKMIGAAVTGQAVSVLPVRMLNSGLIPNPGALCFLTVEGFDIPFTHFLALPEAGESAAGCAAVIGALKKAFQSAGLL